MNSDRDDFERALRFVLKWEGGFVDHPSDPGGRTNKGVTQATYDAWLKASGQAPRDVKGISEGEVAEIYRREYWEKAHCPDLAYPLNVAHFDTAVNMGVGRAVRFLQHAVETTVDGGWGPNTRRCASEADVDAALKRYVSVRLSFYQDLAAKKPSLQVFLKGWLNRLRDLRDYTGVSGVSFSSGFWSRTRSADEPPSTRVPEELGPGLTAGGAAAATSPADSGKGLLSDVMSTLSRAFQDAARLEVRTYTTKDMASAASEGRRSLRENAQLRAFTFTELDGDMKVCVPIKEDGSVNEALWKIHKDLVGMAQTHRTELIRESLGMAANLYKRFVPGGEG